MVVDAQPKWIEAFPINSSISSATIEKLKTAFLIHGLREMVAKNNESNFVREEFDFLKQN